MCRATKKKKKKKKKKNGDGKAGREMARYAGGPGSGPRHDSMRVIEEDFLAFAGADKLQLLHELVRRSPRNRGEGQDGIKLTDTQKY